MEKSLTSKKVLENFLVVGLGNPTEKYINTRHNIGFMFLSYLSTQFGFAFSEKKNYQLGSFSQNNQTLYFLKPMQFMNLSGFAVSQVKQFYKIPLSHIIVCYDDVAFNLGTLKIKENGSSGGHNGIKSIIEQLGTQEFMRIRLGINTPNNMARLEQFVLSPFTKNEISTLEEEVFPKAKKGLESILEFGVAKTMSLFNAK